MKQAGILFLFFLAVSCAAPDPSSRTADSDHGDFRAKGIISPILAVGSIETESQKLTARSAGFGLLPWLPLVDDAFRIDLLTWSEARSRAGGMTHRNAIALPILDVGFYDRRSAGIENETTFISFWGTSLFRSALNTPGKGFRPWLREFDSSAFLRSTCWRPGKRFATADSSRFDGLEKIIDGTRSGVPVDGWGVIDPMITCSRRGESIDSLGVKPLFFWNAREGLSLPFLLTNLSSRGVRFGRPAARYLFPLVYADGQGSRWRFLAGYGTVYAFDGYTACDLKFLFNSQSIEGRGSAWGFLPFPFGHYPGYGLKPEARFVQLRNHAIGCWNVDGRKGFDLFHPILFSMEREAGGLRWDALLYLIRFKKDSAPNNLSTRIRLLWIFEIEKVPEGTGFSILGLPLMNAGPQEEQ